MRSLLDGITSALRIPQQYQQQQQQQQQQQGQELVAPKTCGTNPTPATGSQSNYQKDTTSANKTASSVLGSALYDSSNVPGRFTSEKSPDLPFSMLLLTQNIGGVCPPSDKKYGEEDAVPDGVQEEGRVKGVSDFIQKRVADFLVELRLLIYEASRREFASHTRKEKTSADGLMSTSPAEVDGGKDEAPPLIDVIVVHFQEIGGKILNEAFNVFFAEALKAFLPEAGWSSGLLMETKNDVDQFTALGSILFLSHRMCPISSILSFRHRTFVCVTDDPATYGSSPTFLFHGSAFTGAGSARKGYLLTSLRLGTVVVNFMNIHLYHDGRNTDAAKESPSLYAMQRQEALLEAMAECMVFVSPHDPLFICGDFNTRLDSHKFLQYLKETQQMDVQLTAKGVQAPDKFWELFTESRHAGTIKKFDVELQRLMDVVAQQSHVELAEFAVRFPPTYSRLSIEAGPEGPRKTENNNIEAMEKAVDDNSGNNDNTREPAESKKKAPRTEKKSDEANKSLLLPRIIAVPARGYARQRIPAWCDRVVWNPAGLELMTGRRSSSGSASSPPALAKNDTSTDVPCRYSYRSFSLSHTDHDCVALLF